MQDIYKEKKKKFDMSLCVYVREKFKIALSCSFHAIEVLCCLLFIPVLLTTDRIHWISDPLCDTGLKYVTLFFFLPIF